MLHRSKEASPWLYLKARLRRVPALLSARTFMASSSNTSARILMKCCTSTSRSPPSGKFLGGDEAGKGAPFSAAGFSQCHRRWQTRDDAADHFSDGQPSTPGAGHGHGGAESRVRLL